MITRKDFMAGMAGAAGALSFAALGAMAQKVPEPASDRGRRRPNILLIESDDHAWDALGCMGNPVLKTPNIDRLAERGVVFRYNVCQGTECVPSRHSLLTGSYPHNSGVYSNSCKAIDASSWTMPAALQRNGYRTALIGKNHFPRARRTTSSPARSWTIRR